MPPRLQIPPRACNAAHGSCDGKYNLTVSQQFNDRLSASILIDNVRDEAPPRDPTFDTCPYFSTANQDPHGREGFLQVKLQVQLTI